MPNLLVKPGCADQDGRVHAVTPASAGWTYVGFEVYRLRPGRRSGERPATAKPASCWSPARPASPEAARISASSAGARRPSSRIRGRSTCRRDRNGRSARRAIAKSAVCTAPAEGRLPARLISPDKVGQETRGQGTNIRHVRNILPGDRAGREPARRRGDHARRATGRAIRRTSTTATRCRTSRCSRRPTTTASTRPRALPSSASTRTTARSTRRWRSRTATWCWCRAAITRSARPHGYDLYYLNVMAGPKRTWRFHNDPAHEWMLKASADSRYARRPSSRKRSA